MANETENLDSLNEETELDDNIELDALKTKHQETVSKNRQLFERAKKAETELKDIRVKAEQKPEPKPEDRTPEKSDDFGLLQKTYLASIAKVIEPDEVELAEKGWREYEKHGGTFEQYVSSKVFKIELEEHREKKTNAAATANVRGNATAIPQKEDVEAVAGKLLAGEMDNLPQDKNILADAALRAAEKSKGGGKTFYND